jgi:hypothetical protein
MRRSIFWLVILGGLLFGPVPTALAAAKGQVVAAKWGAESWYVATVVNVAGDKLDVLYGDGESQAGLPATDIRDIPADPQLKAGDKVMAIWSGAKFYPGTVVTANQLSYEIKWDDGSANQWVPAGKVFKP